MCAKKFTTFCQVLKKTHKRKLVHFYLPHGAVITHQSLQLNGIIGYIRRIRTIYDKTDNFFRVQSHNSYEKQ